MTTHDPTLPLVVYTTDRNSSNGRSFLVNLSTYLFVFSMTKTIHDSFFKRYLLLSHSLLFVSLPIPSRRSSSTINLVLDSPTLPRSIHLSIIIHNSTGSWSRLSLQTLYSLRTHCFVLFVSFTLYSNLSVRLRFTVSCNSIN